MRIYSNGFIGHDHSNTVNDWESGWTKQLFEQRAKEAGMPIDWYFRTAKITYNYNSLGHRSKEILDIDLDNYILCVGCSHTEGIGMESEKIYPHLLAQKLNCDYYNLALSASGMDVVVHNLTVWFSTVAKKPKALIIQWPDFTRAVTGTHVDFLQPHGLWQDDADYARFVDLGITLNFFEAKKMLAHYVVQSFNVPTVYFGLERVIPFDSSTVIEPIIDLARDLAHPGIKSHQLYADSIYDQLINTECLNSYQNTEPKN